MPRLAESKPGPGAYEPIKSLTTDGKYFCSKYIDSRSTALRSFSKRFSEGNSHPGPGQYDHPQPVNPKGRNFLSRFPSSFSRTFGNEKRKSVLDGGQSNIKHDLI